MTPDTTPPPPKPNRTVWFVLLGVFGVLFVGCVGLCGLVVVWGVGSFAANVPAAQAAADGFFNTLRANQTQAAYQQTSTGFRAALTQQQFDAFMKQFPTLTGHTARTTTGAHAFQGTGGKRVTLRITLTAPNNATTCTVVMVEEAGAWKVEKLSIP